MLKFTIFKQYKFLRELLIYHALFLVFLITTLVFKLIKKKLWFSHLLNSKILVVIYIYSVGVLGSRAHYLCIYWAPVPIREHEVVRGGVNITRGVRVGKWRSWFWLWEPIRVVRRWMPPRLTKAEVWRGGLLSRGTF